MKKVLCNLGVWWQSPSPSSDFNVAELSFSKTNLLLIILVQAQVPLASYGMKLFVSFM